MEYIVILEKQQDRYRGTVPALPGCVAEGKDRTEALAQMKQAIATRLNQVEVTTVEVEVPSPHDPWLPFLGMWKTDSTWEEFQAEIAKYRHTERVNGKRL